MIRHDKIGLALSRYDSLYPNLIKQKVKESSNGARIKDILNKTPKESH